ncbi:phytochrome sensor protein [Halovivax gelatinilyticus]|uniref:phytochrome sensor protein n=1 Tax=Halovivax gelatinilyticus TaxID=2961597 RepID=UPI0020CA770D|nr:phytochrome sensor protein [Halovivax gelatinilyticus]
MTRAHTVVYVAATDDAAAAGAEALRAAAPLDVGFATPDSVIEHVDTADCIVFAETPTTAEGAAVLDVIEVADDTPVVLFTDSSFASSTARATDGVDGYARRDTPEAVSHLADEVMWVCERTVSDATRERAELAERADRAAAHLASEYGRAARAAAHLAEAYDRSTETISRLEAENRALEAERDRIAARFERQSDPVMAYAIEDGRPICTAVTDGFVSTFGTDEARVRGEPVVDVFSILDAGTDGIGQTLREKLTDETGDRSPIDWRCETTDGTREVEVTITTAADPASGTAGLIRMRDVTDLRRIERELAALEARLESVGELVETDARPSLNVARGYLELASETGDPDDFAEIDAAHETMSESFDHLARVVGRDADIIDVEVVSLFDLARQSWVAADTGDARLDLDRNARFEADRTRLRTVFEHLFSVATAPSGDPADGEFSPAGPTVVSVGAADDGFYVAGTVAGSADDPLAGTTAAGDGTGIRLGLVERVAEAHGWHVGVAENEEGTAFAFRGVDVEPAE